MSETTTQDWTTLPAGRDLDRLVHAHVFGKCAHTANSFRNEFDRMGYQIRRCTECGETTDQKGFIPWYSSSWDNAERVVKEMHERVFANSAGLRPMPWPHANYLTLSCTGVGVAGYWAAAFTTVAYDSDSVDWFERPHDFDGARGETAPLAICRAALAALAAA